MIENDNIVLTASQADDYLVCPLNFYYKYVLNVPELPSSAAAVGSLFHSIIQQLHETKMQDRQYPTLKSLSHKLIEEWPQYGYDSKIQYQRALDFGLESLKNIYKKLQSESPPQYVEHPFRIKIPDSHLVLHGIPT